MTDSPAGPDRLPHPEAVRDALLIADADAELSEETLTRIRRAGHGMRARWWVCIGLGLAGVVAACVALLRWAV